MLGRIAAALYAAARLSRDAKAVSSGSPEKVARRAKNKLVGRIAGRVLSRLYR